MLHDTDRPRFQNLDCWKSGKKGNIFWKFSRQHLLYSTFPSSNLNEIRTKGSSWLNMKRSEVRFEESDPLRGSNGGLKGVKMGSWGSNLIWALIFTKFGGKERFCKLLNNLSLDLHFFYFESPVWPPEGVKWGSNGGQILFELWSSPNLVGRSIFASC